MAIRNGTWVCIEEGGTDDDGNDYRSVRISPDSPVVNVNACIAATSFVSYRKRRILAWIAMVPFDDNPSE